MAIFFLALIYITFISLGLPDSLLGSAWSVMRLDLGEDLSSAGMISMVITGGTIVSSLLSERMIRRFKTGAVTAVSVLATAIALLGFSVSTSLWMMILFAVPLGLGAGAVDAGLNNYVAVHYKPHHMSWLHCFWGMGAFSGPLIMAGFIGTGNNWRGGYLTVGGIQLALAVFLLASLPLWRKREQENPTFTAPSEREGGADSRSPGHSVLRIKGVIFAMLTFFLYSGVELNTSVWGSSYLVEYKGVEPAAAAGWISLYFIGITIGRFFTGFLTMRMSNRRLIRLGIGATLAGCVLLILPLPAPVSLVALLIMGIGSSPIFPCLLHETPVNFGRENSQKIMGIQMASSYTGSTLWPPIVGFLASSGLGIGVFPVSLIVFSAGMIFTFGQLCRVLKAK